MFAAIYATQFLADAGSLLLLDKALAMYCSWLLFQLLIHIYWFLHMAASSSCCCCYYVLLTAFLVAAAGLLAAAACFYVAAACKLLLACFTACVLLEFGEFSVFLQTKPGNFSCACTNSWKWLNNTYMLTSN